MIRIVAQNFDNEQITNIMFFRWQNGFLVTTNKKFSCELELGSKAIKIRCRNSESIKTDFEIRRPLLARGTKAACLGLIGFLTTSGHANQLSGYAFMCLEGANRWEIPPASSSPQDPLHH